MHRAPPALWRLLAPYAPRPLLFSSPRGPHSSVHACGMRLADVARVPHPPLAPIAVGRIVALVTLKALRRHRPLAAASRTATSRAMATATTAARGRSSRNANTAATASTAAHVALLLRRPLLAAASRTATTPATATVTMAAREQSTQHANWAATALYAAAPAARWPWGGLPATTDCLPSCGPQDCGPRSALIICVEDCQYSSDNDCDDGGPGAEFAFCEWGTDCIVRRLPYGACWPLMPLALSSSRLLVVPTAVCTRVACVWRMWLVCRILRLRRSPWAGLWPS